MELTLAHAEDLPMAMTLIAEAKAHLREAGIDQWQDGYPDTDCIREDIEQQRAYLLADGGEALGYLCLEFAGEPAYDNLHGRWKSTGAYGVLHRLAIGSKSRGRGLASTVFALAEALCKARNIPSLRADTDRDNLKMQHILSKNGFEYRGTVQFDGSEKIAFEKLVQ